MLKCRGRNCDLSSVDENYEAQAFVENRVKCYPLENSRIRHAMDVLNIKMQKLCKKISFDAHINFNYILRQLDSLEKRVLIPFDLEAIKLARHKVLSLAKRPHTQASGRAINNVCMTLIKMNSKYSA